MSIENDFNARNYAERIMKAKGYDPEANDENADVFELQWPFWQDLINRHRIGDDLSRAEQILTRFAQRETFGGVTKVLESFSKHLEAQPKQGGSPDWSKAGREWRECGYCDGRGIVSEIPCRVERRGETVDRVYSFACGCDSGRRFPGMKVAEDWMIRHAADRKSREIAEHRDKLRRFGVDPDADQATRNRQFARAIRSMREQIGRNGVTAKTVQPVLPKTVEEARAVLGRPKPPESLDPERLAYSIFDNGDERNEWE